MKNEGMPTGWPKMWENMNKGQVVSVKKERSGCVLNTRTNAGGKKPKVDPELEMSHPDDLLVSRKNLFVELGETISREVNVSNCLVCGNSRKVALERKQPRSH